MSVRSIRNFLFSPIVIYIFRCIIGFSAGYFLMLAFPHYDLFWALLSILLVISPEAKDAKKLSIERVKATLIGALSGFVAVFIPLDMYFKITVGIILAAILCKVSNPLNVSRTAVVAVIIILIEKPDDGFMAPIERFLSVLVGCLIGLLVTIITSFFIKFFHRQFLKWEYGNSTKTGGRFIKNK